eukprot:COSAG01_NODE_2583_length_7421_cov_3.605163_7_plen_160_part_00
MHGSAAADPAAAAATAAPTPANDTTAVVASSAAAIRDTVTGTKNAENEVGNGASTDDDGDERSVIAEVAGAKVLLMAGLICSLVSGGQMPIFYLVIALVMEVLSFCLEVHWCEQNSESQSFVLDIVDAITDRTVGSCRLVVRWAPPGMGGALLSRMEKK